jgi:ParB family chromosome partitioning protein
MNEKIIMIPIDQIHILNPRLRDRKKFELIVTSIKNLGLKKPIQVSLRSEGEAEGLKYDLVCGQGRIEAFRALGHTEIPAIVVEVSKEDRLLRSLVENIARRFASPMDLLREIERLKAQGYSHPEIAGKLDISGAMLKGLIALKNAGEERLLQAAVSGRIPLWIAIDIARADTAEMQRELLKAYENKDLNYVSIRVVKRLMDQRRFLGKQARADETAPRKGRASAEKLVAAYRRESQRQKSLLRKAKLCDAKLLFVVTALDQLLGDGNFVTLLRAEALATMPKYLWSKLAPKHKEVV